MGDLAAGSGPPLKNIFFKKIRLPTRHLASRRPRPATPIGAHCQQLNLPQHVSFFPGSAWKQWLAALLAQWRCRCNSLRSRGRRRSLWLVSSCSHVLRRAECVLGACRRSTGRKVTIRGWRLPDKNNTAGTRSNSTPCSFHNARPTTRLIR